MAHTLTKAEAFTVNHGLAPVAVFPDEGRAALYAMLADERGCPDCCETCNGKGEVERWVARDEAWDLEVCPDCGGHGGLA